MILEENEKKISILEQELLSLPSNDEKAPLLKEQLKKLKEETYTNLKAWDRVLIARSEKRIKAKALVDKLVNNFKACSGFLTSVNEPQVFITPTTKNKTNRASPIA